MSRLFGTLALLLLTIPVASEGQALDSLATDTRVRVDVLTTSRSWRGREQTQSVSGALAGVRGDTVLLVVRSGVAPIRIPLASTRALFVTRGRPPRWEAALRGAVLPAVMGAAFSAVSASIRRSADDPSPGRMALSSAAWGAASGAVLGAWSPKERWRRLTAPPLAYEP